MWPFGETNVAAMGALETARRFTPGGLIKKENPAL
jgi:hypothetical protein